MVATAFGATIVTYSLLRYLELGDNYDGMEFCGGTRWFAPPSSKPGHRESSERCGIGLGQPKARAREVSGAARKHDNTAGNPDRGRFAG
jgi:hypothetical protein